MTKALPPFTVNQTALLCEILCEALSTTLHLSKRVNEQLPEKDHITPGHIAKEIHYMLDAISQEPPA